MLLERCVRLRNEQHGQLRLVSPAPGMAAHGSGGRGLAAGAGCDGLSVFRREPEWDFGAGTAALGASQEVAPRRGIRCRSSRGVETAIVTEEPTRMPSLRDMADRLTRAAQLVDRGTGRVF